MDITDTLTPKSDQLNAEDLLAGPRTFTIDHVTKPGGEQPVEIHMTGYPGRPFKPSKTVRRILVAAWGTDGAAWSGRRMTLYRDAAVKFGGEPVGGIRVSHLSDIDRPVKIALTVTRGKRAPFTVDPLPPIPPEIVALEQRIDGAGTLDELKTIAAELKTADLGEHRAQILAAWTTRGDTIKAGGA